MNRKDAPNSFLACSRRRRVGLAGLLAGVLMAATTAQAQQEEDLRVFHESSGNRLMNYVDAPNSLYRHLARDAAARLDERAAAVASLRTAEDWRARQASVRSILHEVVGPFPERTPLEPRVTGTLERDGIRVEKLLFHSRPGYPVTAALFLPRDARGPAPAIVYFSGHNAVAFRSAAYQRVILNLVRKGFVVLAVDPVGQGERLQYLDPQTGKSRVGGNTLEHSYAGAQLFLTGGSLAREMTWDGMRAIDYLVSRPEVDPARIGVTGRSGGGTQSAYVAALDPRVRSAAVENYLVSLRRLWETRGPQDAEQHFYHGIARGLDHPDLLLARAPRPTLVIATTRDIFNIQGTREMFAEAKRGYTALGAPEALRMVEDDAAHQSTPANREALYAFFQETLEMPGDARDEAVEPFAPAELRVTPTGQVSTASAGAETPFSLNAEVARAQSAALEQRRTDGAAHVARARDEARRLSGYADPGAAEAPLFMGRYRRAGYVVEKHVVPAGDRYPIPFLLMRADSGAAGPAILYLHPKGKAAEAAPGAEMEALARQGWTVIAPDPVGAGELGPGDFRGDSYGFPVGPAPYGLWFGAVSLGRSFTGLQAGDLVRLIRSVRRLPGVPAERVTAIARGEAASALLHAAAFEPAIAGIALVEPLLSYADLARTREYGTHFVPAAVAGMLTAYDLPDLAASLAPRPLLVLRPVDPAGAPQDAASARATLSVTRDAYARGGAQERLVIAAPEAGEVRDALLRWLRTGGAPHDESSLRPGPDSSAGRHSALHSNGGEHDR